MVRTLIAGLLGGFALYLVGFLFWGTPLSGIAFGKVADTQSLAVQQALATNLPATGTYLVPDPASPAGTVAFGQGPIAMVHFNIAGFPVVDSASLIAGLILALVIGLVLAAALAALPRALRIRTGLLTTIAVAAYLDLGQPIFNHAGWTYFTYLFVGDAIGFGAAVAAITWFLARGGGDQITR
jgi:hypothetical protein